MVHHIRSIVQTAAQAAVTVAWGIYGALAPLVVVVLVLMVLGIR